MQGHVLARQRGGGGRGKSFLPWGTVREIFKDSKCLNRQVWADSADPDQTVLLFAIPSTSFASLVA